MANDAFAEVRSLMNRPSASDSDWSRLRSLLEKEQQSNPGRYASEWFPYLEGFTHHFEAYFERQCLEVISYNDVAKFRRIYPHFRVRRNLFVTKTKVLYELLDSEEFECYRELSVYMRTKFSAKAIKSIAKSPHAGNLRTLALITEQGQHAFINQGATDALAKLLDLPSLRSLGLRTFELGDVSAFANAPGLSKLRSLAFTDAITINNLAVITSSPHLGNLESLSVYQNRHRMSVEPITQNPNLGSLTSLSLTSVRPQYGVAPVMIGDEGCQELARTEHLSGLTRLGLAQGLTDEGAKAIAESSVFGNLEKLGLANNAIGDDGVIALANSPHLHKLVELDLSYNTGIGAQGLRALAFTERLPSLQKLTLERIEPDPVSTVLLMSTLGGERGCEIKVERPKLTREDTVALAEALDVNPLERVMLRFRYDDAEAAEPLFASKGFAVVKHLDMSCNGDVPVLRELARSEANPTWISLSQNTIEAEDIVAFVEAGKMEHVEHLDLTYTSLDDAGLAALLDAPVLGNLRELRLDSTKITSDGFAALAAADGLTGLETLHLPYPEVEQLELLSTASWITGPDKVWFSSLELGEEGCKRLVENPSVSENIKARARALLASYKTYRS